MKITAGKMIEAYAVKFDLPQSEVIAWLESYINEPELWDDKSGTEEERAASIKAYVASQVDGSCTQ
jgi:hypothetical protein